MTDRPAHLADDILNAWIDGVATMEERAIVDHHLATCATCERRAGELRAIRTMISTLPEITPRRSFTLSPEQAQRPTPIRERTTPSKIIRLLPIVRAMSVAAMIAVLVLGATLAISPRDDTVTLDATTAMAPGETRSDAGSFEETNPAPASQERGEVVDQGEAASAHDSTTATLERETPPVSIGTTDGGLTSLEIATIVLGVLAIVLGVSWMWMSMAIRGGRNR